MQTFTQAKRKAAFGPFAVRQLSDRRARKAELQQATTLQTLGADVRFLRVDVHLNPWRLATACFFG